MIVKIIKLIVSGFLLIVALLLFSLWLVLGTLLLVAMIIRFISLYTIALLNSFVSSTPLTQDYSKAIEEVIDMYLDTYGKILSMPTLPWKDTSEKHNNNLRALLPNEITELKKSWAITLVVFISYIFAFGLSFAYLTHKENKELKAQYEIKIAKTAEKYRDALKFKQVNEELNEKIANAVNDLYVNKRYSIGSISGFFNTTPDEIRKIIDANNIKRK